MIIIWEGDSEKGNIDVKTSARKETRSFEYTSIAIQADSPEQDIEGQENIKPSKPCCKFGPGGVLDPCLDIGVPLGVWNPDPV